MTVGPALRTLAATVGAAFGIQAAAGAVAIPLQTEKFYDATGSLTFIACTGLSLYYPFLRRGGPLPALSSFHSRQLIASGFAALWAARLGSFLYQRIKRSGSDSRFDEIKKSPVKFGGAWFAQGVWVSLTALPVFAINAIPRGAHPALAVRDFIAIAFWLAAFTGEVIADRQKSAWRAAKEAKKHDEKFISSGLWSISRHPNYVGEVGLWAAQALLASSALSAAGVSGVLFPAWMAYAVVVSPVMEYLLIRYVSGVPMLEESGDKKFGGSKEWEEYKKNTPVFFPFPKF